jgi:arylsulfatase A-like enzyme
MMLDCLGGNDKPDERGDVTMSTPFRGRIGRTVAESTPSWPELPMPRKGAPNVLVVVLDDTGFAHFGCYGSSIETPNIDRLAAGGLRYSNFHTTALCSPTRAALLTGRNHHTVGMRGLSNWNTGFPNCTGTISRGAATLAEMLRPVGYATYAVGKWHLTPMEETSPAGPFDQWPLGRGFDRFYGFLQGETDQFVPELFHDNHPVDPPRTPEQGYHLTEDLVDRAIGFVRDQKSVVPEKPFFLYLAFGATHSPHQAPPEYLAKYRGRFDAGWDEVRQQWFERQKALGVIPADTELAPRNPGVKPWVELSDGERRLALRLQEAFAAMLDHTDHHIGRLVEFLASIGELDNTLLMVLSDNGASQEGGPIGVIDAMRYFNNMPETLEASLARIDDVGGPRSHTNYPWGWAQAGNCPGKRYKQNTHGGGVRDPLVVHWPATITDRGGIRTQFHHVTDLAPTVLEVVGVDPPASVNGVAQLPVYGTSLAYTFPAEAAAERTRKPVQYFEMFGSRGIWADGWKAVAWHRRLGPYEDDQWELYHLDSDFSECRDLAQERPEKLRQLIELWWAEAGRHGVLPLDDRTNELWRPTPRLFNPRHRRRFVYHPPVSYLNSDIAPPLGNRTFTVTATLVRPGERTEGVIFAYGKVTSGLAMYVLGDRLVFDYNCFGVHQRVVSTRPIPAGRSEVAMVFRRLDRAGQATLRIDGEDCGSVEIPQVMRMISPTGMHVGRNPGSAVSPDYAPPFAFEGQIEQLVFQLPEKSTRGEQQAQRAEANAFLARQ